MNVLYFATVNWRWIKQRPQFIASQLAEEGHHVEYFSLTPFGKSKITRKSLGRLRIHDLYTIPFSHKLRIVENLNRMIIKSYLNRQQYDVIILTSPLQYLYIPKKLIDSCLIIYECMDNIPYFYKGYMRHRMLMEEVKTMELVDGIVTSSERLKNILMNRMQSIHRSIPITCIRNAMDKETFLKKPRKIKLKEPNLIYIGTISSWLDWDVIRHFARRNHEYTIYLIGPTDMQIQGKLESNICMLGPLEHEVIIDYIYSGNIMLLPFRISELTEAVDPVKIYEYIAFHKPVVSSYWPELEKFAEHNVFFYETHDDFESQVHTIKDTFDLEHNKTNYPFIMKHNWELRTKQYLDVINNLIHHKEKG